MMVIGNIISMDHRKLQGFSSIGELVILCETYFSEYNFLFALEYSLQSLQFKAIN